MVTAMSTPPGASACGKKWKTFRVVRLRNPDNQENEGQLQMVIARNRSRAPARTARERTSPQRRAQSGVPLRTSVHFPCR
jgi:hypothetical protein